MRLIDLITLLNRACHDEPNRVIRLGFKGGVLYKKYLAFQPYTDATVLEMLGTTQLALGSIVGGQIISVDTWCVYNSDRYDLDDVMTEVFDAPYDSRLLQNILQGRALYGHLAN